METQQSIFLLSLHYLLWENCTHMYTHTHAVRGGEDKVQPRISLEGPPV